MAERDLVTIGEAIDRVFSDDEGDSVDKMLGLFSLALIYQEFYRKRSKKT